jgi:hypothetical protein
MAAKATDKDAAGGNLTVSQALAMYEYYKSYWSENYKEANIDLKMIAGDPRTHWGEAYNPRREAKKLTLVINELPQFIHQVTNDIRQNVPSIKVLPVSDGDIETGKIFSGLFRAIEDHSHADEVCDTASEYAVKCGIGFMRLDHDYCYDDSDEQEIIFKTVPDPLSVWIDPASVEYDGRDAMGAIALEPISKKEFERLYPGKNFVSFTDPKNNEEKETIVLGEVFVKELSGKRGKNATIYRYKFSGADLLAKTTFPGKYIPVIPIYGEVTWIDGKRIIAGLVRQARDPQLRLNHWACKEQEILNMAPIAPVMAVQGTLVNNRSQWQSPGAEMVLEYKPKDLDGNPAPQPTRLNPPPVPTGIINAMEGAKQNIKESLGMYNASIGEKSNEVSGVAIDARKHEGDVATFHFPDNVRRSYGHMGEVAVEMMPVIYDTPRIVQTLNEEQDVQMIGINGAPLQDGQTQPYDLTKGKYRVRITTGASYTTKRQEEAAFLSQVFQKDPALMQIGGDILFNSMDTPGAQALAARIKKTIPPQLLEDNGNADPRLAQIMQQMQQMQEIIQKGAQEIQQLQAELQNKQTDEQLQAAKLQIESKKLDVEQQKLQVEAFKAKSDALMPFMQAAASQQVGASVTPDMDEGQIMALLQSKQQEAVNAELLEQQRQQQEAEEKARQEAIEAQQHQQDMEMRAAQTNAVLTTLTAITQQLHMLTEQVSKPKDVKRDPTTGAITGIA